MGGRKEAIRNRANNGASLPTQTESAQRPQGRFVSSLLRILFAAQRPQGRFVSSLLRILFAALLRILLPNPLARNLFNLRFSRDAQKTAERVN
ncbi:MAG: hypothetical protein DCC52_08170 [Chloroflexi bacterium]|nr:MAG: hypothetical protein DCC52_08170 [Chloroflexota bacterium]